ncbi:hypothetical protein [Hyalangium sp.]|uniref:hypothetical protein n=1 Tax=Hyalangium sp. TaxID=2028555 RepID=UPI002D3FE94F|nr:hypothetical protein [Hyalangium sp.]HYI01505.1 hypothetical protein [Hyalangium sp.]
MNYGLIAVGTLVLGMLVGCGPVDTNEALSSVELKGIADGTQLSPEMMDVVLSQAPKLPEELLQGASTCQAAKTCAGSVSCGSWSNWYSCGLTACKAYGCQYRGSQRNLRNRSRVCVNSAGTSCTEYEYLNNQPEICGCNDL